MNDFKMQNCPKIHQNQNFSGLRPEPAGGAYSAPADPKPHPRSQPFGLRALALRASQVRPAHFLNFNAGPPLGALTQLRRWLTIS